MIGDLLTVASDRRRLTLLALMAASVSIVALLLHVAGWLPMHFLINVLAAPSVALLVTVTVIAHRIDERIVVNRLVTGAWAGLVATLAYDGLRYLLIAAGLLSYDPFASHPLFGRLITGYPAETVTAIVVGWLYHFWNGVGFGIIYSLIAGPAHWYYALGWAMFLEVGWLTAMPSLLQFKLSPEFLAVSVSGHAAYGIVLGLLTQRYVSV